MGGAGLTTSWTRPAGVIVALATAALVIFVGSAARGSGAAGAGTQPPNFVMILVDDQAMNTFKPAYMPRTFHEIVDQGTRFRNGIAAPPLCCPDRAGILTGQYPHNHGVFSNIPGYPTLRNPQDTLPVWLQRAGYHTGLVGKYLNNYTDSVGTAPAPGFDSWFGMMEPFSYYDYDVSNNGKLQHFGDARSDYSTDAFTRQAIEFLRASSQSTDPFLLWLAYEAPHGHSKSPIPPCRLSAAPPDRASIRAVEHVPLPRPPSFNERDVSDKPAAIRDLPRLSHEAIERIKNNWHCALAAVGELDKQVGLLMQELQDDREAQNTIVIYVSDNGVFFGEHRLPDEKSDIYEPALNVPFAVRVPRAYRTGPRVRASDAVVTNQDIAATMIAYAGQYLGHRVPTCAGAGDCRRMDGRSFAPLVGGSGGWPADRGALVEIHSGDHQYHAIRTPRYVYSKLATGERELYDLGADPFELRNRAGARKYKAVERRLGARLTRLRKCSGIRGRDAPTARPFCQ